MSFNHYNNGGTEDKEGKIITNTEEKGPHTKNSNDYKKVNKRF